MPLEYGMVWWVVGWEGLGGRWKMEGGRWKVEDGLQKCCKWLANTMLNIGNAASSLQTEWHRVLHGNLYHLVG